MGALFGWSITFWVLSCYFWWVGGFLILMEYLVGGLVSVCELELVD